ncbi:cyclase family protein [Desulfovibrio aerotolerans]|uniref:Cyclase family protein n=1 Tax=Solidesulfovibrio aerotolerans TaxID=295255 RepID=A0A7C9J878_9BACT|nr:cyclase family protein [Solidesulfovibrio aerotolerans]
MNDPARVIDISLPLGPPTPPVPGDPPFARRLFLTHETDGCEAAAWCLSAHSAAHIDFPAHFLPQGKRAGDYPVAAFFPPAVVIDCGQALRLGPDVLAGVAIHPGEAVLFCTVNSREQRFAQGAFPDDFASVTPQLARELITRRVSLVGLDAMSIEPLTDPAYPVHRLLLASGVLILEGLILSQAAPGRYRLACPPLAVAEAEASPVRAVLWQEPA